MAYNVEASLIAWLSGQLGVPAYAEVPDPRPGRFLTVQRTGGNATVGIDNPVIAVQAWAGSAYDACTLALDVRDLMLLRAVEVPEIRHVDIGSGPYTAPDADSRQPAYQVTFNLVTCM